MGKIPMYRLRKGWRLHEGPDAAMASFVAGSEPDYSQTTGRKFDDGEHQACVCGYHVCSKTGDCAPVVAAPPTNALVESKPGYFTTEGDGQWRPKDWSARLLTDDVFRNVHGCSTCQWEMSAKFERSAIIDGFTGHQCEDSPPR